MTSPLERFWLQRPSFEQGAAEPAELVRLGVPVVSGVCFAARGESAQLIQSLGMCPCRIAGD